MISQAAPVSTPKVPSPATTKAETVLSTDQLVEIYGGRAVVDGINMHVGVSEIVGLLGPNGAGKTTSFYMIVGLIRPNSGRVIFSDTDVTDYPMYKRARLGMGYLPQEESIFRKMTVEQNILAILETLPLSKAERRNRCDQLLHQFGIERIAKNTALTLSGGEKRRLTIARSLVTQPKLLMLDEPFSGVDPIAVYDVQQIIVNLRKSGLAIMITDHNVRETLSIVDRAYLIYDGRVESEGTKDFLINDPISRQPDLDPDRNFGRIGRNSGWRCRWQSRCRVGGRHVACRHCQRRYRRGTSPSRSTIDGMDELPGIARQWRAHVSRWRGDRSRLPKGQLACKRAHRCSFICHSICCRVALRPIRFRLASAPGANRWHRAFHHLRRGRLRGDDRGRIRRHCHGQDDLGRLLHYGFRNRAGARDLVR